MRYYDGKGPEQERPVIKQNNQNESAGGESYYGVDSSIGIIEQGKSALTKPSRLPGLGSLPGKKFAGYSFVLLLLVSVIVYVIPMVAAVIGFGGFETLFQDKLPAFTVENGELDMEKGFEMAIPNLHVIIDTDQDACELPDTDAGGMYLLIGKKEFSLSLLEVAGNRNASQTLMEGRIGDYLPDGMTKKDLTDTIPAIYLTLVLAWIMVILGLFIRYFFMGLIYMLFSVPVVKKSGLPMNNKEIFRMCFYAQTFGILMVNINTATGLLPGGIVSIAGIIITCVYIFRSVKEYTRPTQED